MTITDTPPHDHHATIAEAGRCAECRDWTIAFLSDAPDAYALVFFDDNGPSHGTCTDPGCNCEVGGNIAALAVVRDWSPDPVEAAWATGCNTGGQLGILGPFPAEIAERSGAPLFTLIAQPGATAALDALKAAAKDG